MINRKNFLVVFLVPLIFLGQLLSPTYVQAATYTFSQNSWSGGTSISSPTHDQNQTGWTNFSSSENVDVSSGIKITPAESSVSKTTFDDFSTGSKNQTSVTGAGIDGSVILGTSNAIKPKIVQSTNSTFSFDSYALKSDGTVWAWGANGNGQIGDNTTTQRLYPVQVLGSGGVGYLTGVVDIAASSFSAYALKSDGTVWAWGDNGAGQLGDNTTTKKYTPVQVKDSLGTGFLTNIIDITASGANTVYALSSDGTVWAWGAGASGQLGDGTNVTSRKLPAKVKDPSGTGVLSNVTAIAGGHNASAYALLSDGKVVSWGKNEVGQLGNNSTVSTNLPVYVVDTTGTGNLSNIVSIVGGGLSAYALSSDGKVYGWGDNTKGQLGIGNVNQILTPVKVLHPSDPSGYLNNVVSIAGGYMSAFALKSDGTVWGWGENDYRGQLGDNTAIQRETPIQVNGLDGVGYLSDISSISSGYGFAFAVQNDGTVWGWGLNANKQIGDGVTLHRDTPVKVLDNVAPNFFNIGSNVYHTSGTFTSSTIDLSSGVNLKTLNFDTTLNSQNITVDLRVGNTSTPDGTWTSWLNNVSNGGDISSLGNKRYFQYRLNLSTSNNQVTPRFNSLSLTYNSYTQGTLTSSVYDSFDSTNAFSKISWTATDTDVNNTIKFQVRTSSDGINWSSWCGYSDCTGNTYFESSSNNQLIQAGHPLRSGGDDEYIQYKVYLNSQGSKTPILNNVNISYLINAAPSFNNDYPNAGNGGVEAYQVSDEASPYFGKVYISYSVLDSDSSTGTTNPNKVKPSFEYSRNGGSSWTLINSAELRSTDLDLKNVSDSSYIKHDAVWDVAFGTGSLKVRVNVSDNELSNSNKSAVSQNFSVDKIAPHAVSSMLSFNAGIAGVLNSATVNVIRPGDDNNVYYYIRDDETKESNPKNTGWVLMTDNITIPWTFDSDVEQKSLKFKFKDTYGNQTQEFTVSTLDPRPANSFMVQDISNLSTSPKEYTLYLAWQPLEDFTGFNTYMLEVSSSADGVNYGDYKFIPASGLNDVRNNFYVYKNLDPDTYYKFRISVYDNYGNITVRIESPFVTKPDGVQNFGEGGGGSLTSSSIVENVLPEQLSSGNVNVSYKIKDSSVSKKTNASYDARLFYNTGLTLASNPFTDNTLKVSNSSYLPDSGFIQINNEVIKYENNNRQTNTLSSLTRGVWVLESRKTRQNAVFLSGTPVWVMAKNTTPNSIDKTNISSGLDLSILWNTFEDVSLFGRDYKNVAIKVLVHDNQDENSGPLSSQNDYSETGLLDTLSLDKPTISFDKNSDAGLESVSSFEANLLINKIYPKDVSVNYTITGTATSGVDYTLASGVANISSLATTAKIIGSVVNDLNIEKDETVIIKISNPVNAYIGSIDTFTYTIQNDENLPNVGFENDSSSGLESVSNVTIPVVISSVSEENTSVEIEISGTATLNTDFTIESNVVSFDPNQNTQNIKITILEDGDVEQDETIIIGVKNPNGLSLGSILSHTYTITNNDEVPSVAFASTESSSLENVLNPNVEISIPFVLDKNVTVDYQVSSGTATTGTDFVLTSGKATIIKGETTTSIPLSIVNDTLKESDETIVITLSNPVNAILVTGSSFTYTILDDENIAQISFLATESSGLENQKNVSAGVVMSSVSELPVSFDYVISGTSTYGQDHNLNSGTVTINPGKTSANINFEITDDILKEIEETLIITLSNPVNANIVSGSDVFTYKILDNDSFPNINFVESAISKNESVVSYDIVIAIDSVSTLDATVDYQVSSGTATTGTDFVLTSGKATIIKGETTTSIPLSIVNDTLKESDETIVITLSNPVNAILGTGSSFTYTLVDDDAYPTIDFGQVNVSNTENVTSVKIPLSLSEASGVDILLNYSVAGTASSESDFVLNTREISLLAGSTSTEIDLTIIDDTKKENDENIVVTMTGATGATLGQNKVFTYTITDNDTYPTIGFANTIGQGKEDINTANIIVTISEIYPEDIAFDFSVVGGSAEGSMIDYDIESRRGVIKAGTTNTSIPVVIFDDILFEENENILLKITNATNANLSTNITHAFTIVDNEIAVSDISGSSIKSTSARIVWTTADYTDSLIEYGVVAPGAEGSYSYSKQNLDKVLNHSVYLDELTPDTKYYFKTTSVNLKGETTVTESSFKTTPGPVISMVTSSGESDTSTNISWITDIPSTSSVIYSESPNMENSKTLNVSGLVTSHSVKISDLLPNKLYYYLVNSVDESGNIGESANGGSYYMFGTGEDKTAPSISDVTVPVKTATQAVITWTTNEPTDGKIKYGTTSGEYTESSEYIYKLTNNHLIAINELEESSQYYYVIESADEKGNKTVSSEYVFETPEKEKVIINKGGGGIMGVAQELYDLILAENQAYKARFSTLSTVAPVVSNVQISDITPFSAVISFNTDKDTISFVKYGKDKSYGQVSGNGDWSQSHRIRLSGLALGTEYQFKVSAIDKSNNTGESENGTFTTKFMSEDITDLQKIDNVEQFQKEIESTIESILPSLAPPFIGKPEVSEITENGAKIKFKTNIKSFPIVSFASESSYDSSKENPYDNEVSDSSEKRTVHEIILKGLRPNTKYHYMVKAFSLPQVVGKSDDFVFTTSASKIQASVLDVKKDSFTVVWYTDEPASSIVEYKNIKTGRSAKLVEDEKKTSHSVKIENLEPGSSYEITVSGINAKGNTLESSSVINAKTSIDKKAPEITNVKVDNALVSGRTDKVQTIISWQTDEPSTSTVYYQEGSGTLNGELANKQEDKELTKNHVVILTVLKPGTVYRFTVSSTDEAGNTAKPPVRTIITPKKTESIVDVIFKNFDDTFNFINNVR